MTTREGHQGPDRPDRDDEARLRDLLADAVSDVEPANRLDDIRNQTKVIPMSARRPWLFAVGGAVVATAAVVTAIALAGGSFLDRSADEPPAGQQTRTQDPKPDKTDPATPEPTEATPPSQGGTAVPVYLAGDQPAGIRLFREFQASAGGDPLLEAATASVEGRALDPDYRSLWPAGSSVASVESDGADVLTVDVTGAPRSRPSEMSQEEARMALQQLVYTVQAAYGQGRVGVQVMLDGERTDTVLGEAVSEPLANAPLLQTLSLVSLTTPAEGAAVSGELEVAGVANSFEANVIVRIETQDGTEVVTEPFTAEGWMAERLFPFSGSIDLSDVPPGTYVVIASTDDPSGGAEGSGAQVDTRVIEVR